MTLTEWEEMRRNEDEVREFRKAAYLAAIPGCMGDGVVSQPGFHAHWAEEAVRYAETWIRNEQASRKRLPKPPPEPVRVVRTTGTR